MPGYEAQYAARGWKMFPAIDRVYVNQRARQKLGWQPQYDFAHVLDRLRSGHSVASSMARLVGAKGYHAEEFHEGPYPVLG